MSFRNYIYVVLICNSKCVLKVENVLNYIPNQHNEESFFQTLTKALRITVAHLPMYKNAALPTLKKNVATEHNLDSNYISPEMYLAKQISHIIIITRLLRNCTPTFSVNSYAHRIQVQQY